MQELGAGEIFINSIDRDGTADGYDIEAIRIVSDAVTIPVIACGGVGSFSDFRDAVNEVTCLPSPPAISFTSPRIPTSARRRA